MSRGRRTLVTGLLVSVALLGMSGCLVSEAVVRVLYDSGRDEFRQLVVFERFRYRPDASAQAGEPGKPAKPYDWGKDFAELKKIYEARERSIFVEPGPARLFGMVGRIERTADGKLVEPWEPVAGEPPINFNDVTIKPGELFTDAQGYLGYWHETVMPGKFVDACLKSAVFHLAHDPSSVKNLDAEIARRDAGGARLAWKDLIERTAKEVRQRATAGGGDAADRPAEPERKEGEPDKADPVCYMETASLKAVRQAVADGTLDLGRRKERVYLRLPLTAEDANNVLALIDVVRKEALSERAGEKAEYAELRRKVREAAEKGVTVERPQAGGIEISLDLPIVINAVSEAARWASTEGFKDTPDEQAHAKEMAERAAKDLPVKKGVSVEQLLSEFMKGGGK